MAAIASPVLGAPVDIPLLENFAKIWGKASSTKEPEIDVRGAFDSARPDYPEHLLPFKDHPHYLAATSKQRSDLLSWAWVVYNERTIAAEELIANPAFCQVVNARWPGGDLAVMRETCAQSMVDEQSHTLMHLVSNIVTKERRGLGSLSLPPSITCRSMWSRQARAQGAWQREMLVFAYALVSEVSVNAYLQLLSSDDSIQLSNREIADRHDRDEYVHALLIAEIAKSMYLQMTLSERRFFREALVEGLKAYVATDYSAWSVILDHLRFTKVDEIIGDTQAAPGNRSLVRDYSGLAKLADDLGITAELGFDFSAYARL